MDLTFVKVLTEGNHMYVLKNSRISYCYLYEIATRSCDKNKKKLHQARLIHSVASCDRGGK